MLCNKARLAWVILIVFLSFSAAKSFAESGGGGHGGGGSETPALPKDQREFEDKTSKLNYMSSLIEEAAKDFQHLVHEKNQAKTADEKQAIIRQMNELVDRRNKNIETYNKVRMELTLRYPNKGERLNRHYQPKAQKTVEELEASGGLDEMLTVTKRQIEKKYAPFASPDEKEKHKASSHSSQHGEKPRRLRLEK